MFLGYFFSLFSLFSGNKKKGLKCANLLKKQTAARLCTRKFQGSRVPGSTLAGNPFPFFRKLFLFFQKFIFQIYKMDFIRVEPWNLGTHLLTYLPIILWFQKKIKHYKSNLLTALVSLLDFFLNTTAGLGLALALDFGSGGIGSA